MEGGGSTTGVAWSLSHPPPSLAALSGVFRLCQTSLTEETERSFGEVREGKGRALLRSFCTQPTVVYTITGRRQSPRGVGRVVVVVTRQHVSTSRSSCSNNMVQPRDWLLASSSTLHHVELITA